MSDIAGCLSQLAASALETTACLRYLATSAPTSDGLCSRFFLGGWTRRSPVGPDGISLRGALEAGGP